MFLQYKHHRIHYNKFGKGEKLLIVFHGFGDSGELFLNLKESLEERYTVVALDAPFHGETEWNSGIFYPNDLKNIVNLIRANFEHERFSMMAHSMGGLLVMGIFKYFAKYVDELILLAPAGLQDSVIYNKILFNLPVRQLFKWTSNKPKFSSKLLEMSKKYGWLDRLTHVFFSRQLGDDKLRKRMFNTWASLFFFPRRLSQFRRLIRKYNIELLIYYGQRDSLTPASAGKKFAERLQRRKKTANVEIKLVNDGHFFIRGPLNEALKKKFNENTPEDINTADNS
jgi:pimeloyl-ACP methyl ester carboxylesterase